MCLAIPMRVLSVSEGLATVEMAGVKREASVILLPDAAPGDYVLIHAGFALERLDEQEAQRTLRLFAEACSADETAR